MQNFDFYNPTHIIFGKDRLDTLNAHVPSNAKVLLVYGGGSAKKNGLIDRIKTVLGTHQLIEFGGVEPNPCYETLMKAVEVVKAENVDFLLAIGGGSVIDGTKFIAAASKFDGDARDILKGGYAPLPVDVTVPFGTVLTLPDTGSEMNPTAVVTYEHTKFFFSSPLLFPQFSVVDPTITYTLPERQVANGVVDAFVHVVEQYITFPADGRVQDRMAEGILQTLIEVGGTSVDDPENYDARSNHVWSATMALNGLIGCGVPQDWSSHFIGHELTSLYGIDHGQSLAIVLPSLLEVRKEKKRAKLLQYAQRVWNIETGNDDEKIDQAIAKTRDFFEGLGVKTRLSQYGVSADQISTIIGQLQAHGFSSISETGDMTLDITQQILEKSL